MQRYELADGQSNKFWEAGVTGSELTVRFGRIGTAGQVKTKAFADAQSAQREYEKLVREKTGKGYALAGAGGAQGAGVAARPQPTKHEPAPVEPEPVGRAHEATPGSPPAGTPFPSPSGGLKWTAKWLALLPPLRGVHAPAFEPVNDVPLDRLQQALHRSGWNNVGRMGARMHASPRGWEYWSPHRSEMALASERLRQPDREAWLEWVVHADCAANDSNDVAWALSLCITRQGIAFALETALEAWEIADAASDGWSFANLVRPLRQAIATCADDELAGLEAWAARKREEADRHRVLLAHLFPHRVDWALDAASRVAGYGPHLNLVYTSGLPAAAFSDLLQRHHGTLNQVELRRGLVLQLRLHGDAAFPAFQRLYEGAERAKSYDEARSFAQEFLAAIRVPSHIAFLAGRLGQRAAVETLTQLAKEFPEATLQRVIEYATREKDERALAWAIGLAAREPAALAAALAAMDPTARCAFEAERGALEQALATPDRLPAVLREPPWLRAGRRELPVLDLQPIATPERLTLTPAQEAEAARPMRPLWGDSTDENGYSRAFGLTKAGGDAVCAGQPLPPDGVRPYHGREAMPEMLCVWPEPARLPLWNSYPGKHWSAYECDAAIWQLFRSYGFAAMPGLLAYCQAHPKHGARLLHAFDSPQLVLPQVERMLHGKQFREAAAAWVRDHAVTVLHRVLPLAFRGEADAQRELSRQAVRWLAGEGHADTAREIARMHGAGLSAALETFLAMDPLELLPMQMPRLPAFVAAPTLRRPELRDGGALPDDAMRHLASMLAISAPGSPYAGVVVVTESCTPGSLAAFAWSLAEAWLVAGAPAKEAWALRSLALLGDDATARLLVPRIREWAESGAPSRAVGALDILAAIGTDVALLHLNAFARQNRIKPLQKRAAELITHVAESRGLTEDELGDRLVPTLGLDEDGALELDYGPRRFRLRFDETLHPFLVDAQGQRLKAIPRSNKDDDAAKAKAAIERYKTVRKEAEAIAGLQVRRLERAMVSRRRWKAADFRALFLEHPLSRHLAARLAWAVVEGGRPAALFRIAEDWTLADANDALFALPDDAIVALPHGLELDRAHFTAMGQVFADYEIAQPFRQLSRETFALADGEASLEALTRFRGRRVASVAILALQHLGWRSVNIGEDVRVSSERELAGGLQVELLFGPGVVMGDAGSEPVQTLQELRLFERLDSGRLAPVPFGRLDPVWASEVLRDVELLTPARH